MEERLEFYKTQLGVKGLVDRGVTKIPNMCRYTPYEMINKLPPIADDGKLIPIVDLADPRPLTVRRIYDASTEVEFFRVINHRVPKQALENIITSVKTFHEDKDDVKKDSVDKWTAAVKGLRNRLIKLLSQGLALSGDRLKGDNYLGRMGLIGTYFPYCSEPNQTLGFCAHSDPGMFSIIANSSNPARASNFQVRYHDKRVNLEPVEGHIYVKIDDLLQILSNDRYKSGIHRVRANSYRPELGCAKVNVVVPFSPSDKLNLYGPLDELVDIRNP
ncbi:hypothetical protein KSS87_013678, partial [Heliosperma pusillum]